MDADRRKLTVPILVGLVVAAVAVAAFLVARYVDSLGSDGERAPHAQPGAEQPAIIDADTELVAVSTVLESPDHSAQLCVGGIADSYPPQCGGPKLVGWDWNAVEGEESASGTTWGDYAVFGTFEPPADPDSSGTLTLTRAPASAVDYDGPGAPHGSEDVDFTTPCEEPDGGWQVLDPDLTTEDARSQTIRVANALPDLGDIWVDQSINPAYDDPDNDPDKEWAMNDPTTLILNVSVTGDVEAADALLRQTWGGMLCVSEAEATRADLSRIQREVSELPGMTSSSSGFGHVDLGVTFDDGSLQAQLDDKYGEGVVVVSSALMPAAD